MCQALPINEVEFFYGHKHTKEKWNGRTTTRAGLALQPLAHKQPDFWKRLLSNLLQFCVS